MKVPAPVGCPANLTDVASRARHRIARRLLPFLFVLYVINYLDRANLAYAGLEMTRTLGFTDRVFAIGIGIFFVGYVMLQIPGTLLVERWSARRCIAAMMIVWGGLTALTGVVHTAHQLYAARFLLGAAEAGFFPGVIVYLTHWFIYEDRAKAVANFMAAIPVSFVIGSPLAGAILGVHWLGVEGWRWLFLLEGLPATLLGTIALFYLPDWPRESRWLREDERKWITANLEEEKHARANVSSYTIWKALRHPPVILLATVVFFAYTANYGFVFWFPSMYKAFSGLSNFRVGLLGSIPYLAAFVGMQVNGWHSDYTRERRLHSAVPLYVGALGFLLLIVLPRSEGFSLACFTLIGFAFTFLPAFWALPTTLLTESAAAASIGFINAVGSFGGFIGPYIVGSLHTRTGSFTPSLMYLMVSIFIGATIVVFCREGQHHAN